ncbi:autophagy protein atg9 [Cladophialophora chaetospira]|uniref:Autophagy-related protein 9 n=1 Tax=Cladophialophora chaetospira TaxID=386627 RepID=A0AA38WYP8_9EURO|nr:autophagy protein atg9 [Cladophialophora chaetospira]
MASNFMSRLMSSNNPSASIYEQLREQDEDSEGLDIEETAGMAADAANRRDSFNDQALNEFNPQPLRRGGRNDAPAPARGQGLSQIPRKDKSRTQNRSRRHVRHSKLLDVEEADDDVPASLLIDHHAQDIDADSITLPPPPSSMPDGLLGQDDAGPSTRSQPRRRPTSQSTSGPPSRTKPINGIIGGDLASADPKEKAMFRWVNVVDLDNFLLEVYTYYLYHGFWSTLLMRCFNLLNVAFVVGFSVFLTQCIDYRKIRGSTMMSEILVPQCTKRMGFIPNALLWGTTFVWIWKAAVYLVDIPRLSHMHDFFLYLLDIPEQEIQSISWQEVVSRLMALRDSNPRITSKSTRAGAFVKTQDKQRMDAHDIANRLMRRQNYMIAMINKDILDLTLPIPYFRNRKLLTRTLEWNIELAIMDFVFNRKGQVRPLFLKDTQRKDLAAALRRRFIMSGFTSLAFAPFLAAFFMLRHFFQNFNDYQKNPGQIGMRDYTPFAQWKFREFNELHHLFKRRINMSYPFADRYINQFPKDKTIQIARFVSLLSGAVVSVLGLATILDQDNFLNFEVTEGRTTIFYIGIFGSIWAVARGLLPDDNMVYDTAFSIQEVIQFTHYEPNHWANRLHTVEVKEEFSQFYQMKLVIFLEEVLSIFFTPFMLWVTLPRCSERIIDFFREFTVHVDGIGYVCTFAEFHFMGQAIRPLPKERVTANADGTTTATTNGAANNVNANANANTNLRDDYFASKDNKLEHSYWGFMNDYARNPKTDVHFPYNSSRRRFNFPPPIPGLPSPSFPPAEHGGHPQLHRHGSSGGPLLGSLASPPPQRGAFGTPRFNPLGQNHGASQGHSGQSPLQSLLLDPHHQPSASGFGTSSPQALRPRGIGSLLAKSRRAATLDRTHGLHPDDVAEEEDQPPEDLQATTAQQNGTDPNQASRSGELGSWNYEVDSSSEADSDEENERDVKAIMAPMGPLGLIKQFQKAQTQERGGGLGGIGGEV